jgi:hypothetical protein
VLVVTPTVFDMRPLTFNATVFAAEVNVNKDPDVNAGALMVNGVCVVAVDQFHVCAKFVLSIVLNVFAGDNPDKATNGDDQLRLLAAPFAVNTCPMLPGANADHAIPFLCKIEP